VLYHLSLVPVLDWFLQAFCIRQGPNFQQKGIECREFATKALDELEEQNGDMGLLKGHEAATLVAWSLPTHMYC
jgi:hypothetical protein